MRWRAFGKHSALSKKTDGKHGLDTLWAAFQLAYWEWDSKDARDDTARTKLVQTARSLRDKLNATHPYRRVLVLDLLSSLQHGQPQNP